MELNFMTEYKDIITSIRNLTNGCQPYIDITELLYKHKCYYLLSKVNAENNITRIINTENIINRNFVNERYRTCKSIFEIFENNGIPYVVIKGAILSETAYRDPYYRHSGDLDLLINRKNIDSVKCIFIYQGFIQGRVTDKGIQPFTRNELLFQSAMSHQIAPFIKETGNLLCPYVNVDINTDIMWGEYKEKTEMEYILKNSEPSVICGVSIRKLSAEMGFIQLCLHHYKDLNSIYLISNGSIKLSLFCDIYLYTKNCSLNIDIVKNICNRLDVLQYIYYCIYYTAKIFGDEYLRSYLSYFQSYKANDILNTFGLAEKELHNWNIDFFERLFGNSINEYLKNNLSDSDFEKIKINNESM